MHGINSESIRCTYFVKWYNTWQIWLKMILFFSSHCHFVFAYKTNSFKHLEIYNAFFHLPGEHISKSGLKTLKISLKIIIENNPFCI